MKPRVETSDPPEPSVNPRRGQFGDRFILAAQCAFTMYACDAGYGGYFLVANHVKNPNQYALILGLPSVAALLLVLSTIFIPNLIAPGRLVFPLNITLPIVFGAYTLLTAVLCMSTGNSLILPFEQVRVAQFWTLPGVLALGAFSQVACLSVLMLLKAPITDK